ncbi:MAG: protease inhibitor Inh/omp19 family protein [Beijerinckiaceae bacterium]|nr:protease inhibitor Inh/omp19 family protein [Beijerinckiaceae bacterium]
MILFVRTPRTWSASRGPALIAAACLLACSAGAALAQQSQQKPPQRAAAAPAPRIAEVAGRYAVLREEGKDTLCMVTLSETARGSGYHRAQLAPACRDNGIVIFDPIAWTIDRQGHISLQARKGHKMALERDANGVWQRLGGDPKARPLALRRI